MKKLIVLFIFITISNILVAQSYSSSNPQYNWGNWKQAPCYKGLYIRVQKAYFNKGANAWYYNWEMQNRYSVKIAISWAFYDKKDGAPQYTKSRHTFSPNEVLANGAFGGENEIGYMFDNACFAFKNYNGTILDDCSSEPEVYKKGYYYAECDNGTPNYKAYSGANGGTNSSNNNNNNSSNTSTFNATDLQAAIDKINSLCGKLNLARANAASLNAKYCNKTWQRTDAELREANNAIAAMEKEIDSEDSREKAAQKAAEDKAAAEQKALEEKQAQFEKYMTDGDNYLSGENYNSAINSYSNAVNSATNTSESSRAQNALAAAQKAKADADRKIRVAEKQAVEKRQNEATTAAVTGFAGAMALVKDNYSNGKFAAKFKIGLGYGSIPLIVNSTKQIKSSIKNSNQILFDLAFRLGFFNNKGISFDITPALGIGLSSFQKGTDGGSEEYGSTGTLWLGKKAKSMFKLFAEGGYFFKNGTYNYDEDVALGPTSATDNVEKGEFKYKLLRYGGGFKISFVNDDDLESYVKPGIFLETPSFFSKTTKPTMVFNLQAYILSNALIDFSYSQNYFIPGKLDYASNFKKENKNYFSIKIIRQGKLK